MGTLAPGPRIHGREPEAQVLGEVLDRVASGQLAVALIEGEAGIGKSRLLEDVLENARARGMQVATGQAEELERNRPFGVLAGAFGCITSSPDPRRAAIAALLATHGGDRGPITVTSDPGLQFQAVDAFTALAEELALSGPLVIGVDDLQWADRSSLLTLAAFSRCLAYLPVALVGCLRPVPRLAELERLTDVWQAAGARQLGLTPLGADAVRDLVAETVEAEPGPGLLAEISGAAGNPLFITELLGALTQEKAIQTAGETAEVKDPTLPPTLRLTILRRLSFLSDDALQALQTASVLGAGFSLTDLAAVTGRRAAVLSAALGEAIAARVLEEDGVRLRFRHELIRDAIYEDLPASVRQGLHREAGAAPGRVRCSGPAGCRAAGPWRRDGGRSGDRLDDQGRPGNGGEITRCRRGTAGEGGRADGAGRSRTRPVARRTCQRPDVGGARLRRREYLPRPARPCA
jgi:predicted ATPase